MEQMKREKCTDIDILIVGAGLGGLYAAIECHRQGHNVRVLEGKAQLEGLGDFVGIGPSAVNQFQKWPPMAQTYSSIIYRPNMTLHTHDGTILGGPFRLDETSHYRPVPVARPKLIRAFYEYALSLGILVVFGKRVVHYEDPEDVDRACAVTDQGERFYADVIVASDGIGTKAGTAMDAQEVKAMSSGNSVYRVTFPTRLLEDDPFLVEQYPLEPLQHGGLDYCQVYIGPKGNVIILVTEDITTFLFVHEDKKQAEESWSMRLDPSHILDSLAETGLLWDTRILSLIKKAPSGSVVDYKITFRDPDPIWTSLNGRVVKVGDSAHAFIPNSTHGATQAMEDGLSLAACLKMAGKSNIPLATRVHTKLRFERTSCAQKVGFINREKWGHDDFERVKSDPMTYAKSVGRWLIKHDPEQYVYDNWHSCVDHVVNRSPFKNTNIPPGYQYEHWTMDELADRARKGSLQVDPGDWD